MRPSTAVPAHGGGASGPGDHALRKGLRTVPGPREGWGARPHLGAPSPSAATAVVRGDLRNPRPHCTLPQEETGLPGPRLLGVLGTLLEPHPRTRGGCFVLVTVFFQ